MRTTFDGYVSARTISIVPEAASNAMRGTETKGCSSMAELSCETDAAMLRQKAIATKFDFPLPL
jgi:hypothetical protein